MNPIIKKILFPAVIIRRIHDNYLKRNNPEKLFSIFHKRSTGKPLDIDNPKTMDDKIAYLAFRTDTSEWSRLADKVRVREYVEECGYGENLPQLYGTWERAEDIDFNTLPNAFAIKTNNASATNILVKDKSKMNEVKVRAQLDKWLKFDYGYETCQPHYSRIKPLILAEELLVNEGGINDYKFLCINGKAQYIIVMSDRSENTHNFKVSIFDLNWNPHPKYCGNYHTITNNIPRPNSLEKMIIMAENLSTPFPFVRIDFYEIGGKPVFGEMTFTPGSSSINHLFNREMGDLIQI